MPLYEYKCPNCQARESKILPLARYGEAQVCAACSTVMEKQLSAPAVIGDYPPYNCPITGKRIEGRKAHQENLAKHGCRVLETGELERAKSYHKAKEAEFDTSLEETVGREIASMSPEKREKLACELDHGVTAVVERGTPQT